MSLEKKDLEMMSVSIPVVDWWDIQEDIERLTEVVQRLEKVLDYFIAIYHEERVKNWEMILQKMIEKQEKKGNRNEPAFGRR
jgi:pyruvate-formate lyase-activating enzyme